MADDSAVIVSPEIKGTVKLKGSVVKIIRGSLLEEARIKEGELMKIGSVEVYVGQEFLHTLKVFPIRIKATGPVDFHVGKIGSLYYLDHRDGPKITWLEGESHYSYWVLVANPDWNNYLTILMSFPPAVRFAGG